MKRKIIFGILLFIVLSSFAFAQIGQGVSGARTADETRPKNIVLLYCMKQ